MQNVKPFDYDKKYLEIYDTLQSGDIRGEMAKNLTIEELESSINRAFLNREDFCYETNFDNEPITYALKAIKLGYRLELHFYCLDNLDLAKKRVAIRTANKGHFVSDEIVFHKWKEGYNSLNLYFNIFDYVLILDNSKHEEIPTIMYSLTKNNQSLFEVSEYISKIPFYAKKRFPDIYKILIEA